MPEVSEIAITAIYLLSKLKNRFINSINIIGGRYTHQELNGLDTIQNYFPLQIKDIKSKGKFLWFELLNSLKEPVYLCSTLGLTGEWTFFKNNSSRVVFNIINKNNLNKKYNLYLNDQRNFGTLSFTSDYNVLQKKLNNLARDLLKNPYTNNEFYFEFNRLISKYPKLKNKLIVEFLMEQNVNKSIGSGIGNYLVAEILYDAKISPYTKLSALFNNNLFSILNTSIKKIIKLSFINNSTGYMKLFNDMKFDKKKLPNYIPDINFNHNEIFEFKVYKQKKDPFGNIVTPANIIDNRTTYYVNNLQILYT